MDFDIYDVIGYIRRLDFEDFKYLMMQAFKEHPIEIANYVMDNIVYQIILGGDGFFYVRADWDNGPVTESTDCPTREQIEEIHERYLATKYAQEELDDLIDTVSEFDK